jgi:hypothetical protein
MKRPLPNLLVQGFQLALRNWSFVVWTYAVNLVFGLLAGVPFATGLSSYLDHSLAAEKIAHTINIEYLWELAIHLRSTSFFPMAIHTTGWLNLLQVLVLLVFFAGTIFVYVSAEPPRFSVLLRGGVAYFWRFVRAAILAGCVGIIVMGILLGARAVLLARVGAVYFERTMFLYSAISGGVVLLAALLVRLWWDLVEVYIVRNAMDGERHVRRALLPAFQLLSRYFWRAVGSFFLAGLVGVGALAACLYLWKNFVPASWVWPAFLLAQVGLFLLLASRFWQRAIEASLVMSADPPILAAEEIEASAEDDLPLLAGVEPLEGLSEPTLSELVLKLQTEPWGSPEVVLPPSSPPAAQDQPSISPLDLHETKFPLGGMNPEPQNLVDQEKQTHSEKKPLP